MTRKSRVSSDLSHNLKGHEFEKAKTLIKQTNPLDDNNKIKIIKYEIENTELTSQDTSRTEIILIKGSSQVITTDWVFKLSELSHSLNGLSYQNPYQN